MMLLSKLPVFNAQRGTFAVYEFESPLPVDYCFVF
jgi:hypothetical protein